MSKLKALAIVFLLLILTPTFYITHVQWQTFAAGPKISEAETLIDAQSEPLKLIEANKILRRARNSSDYVAAGSVASVVSKLEENGAIRTYANILIDIPLKGNIKPYEILTAWYYGGVVGDVGLEVNIHWACEAGDSVVLPSVFQLKAGMNVLFFAYQRSDSVELNFYLPLQSVYKTTTNSTSAKDVNAIILSETQPSTTVAESSGYGFGWDGRLRYWADLPVLYYIDPDGTADISGTDEFPAIRAGFQTWEDDCFSGFDFTDNGTGVHETIDTLGTANGMNVATWTLRTPAPDWVARTWVGRIGNHIVETDIEFDDNRD